MKSLLQVAAYPVRSVYPVSAARVIILLSYVAYVIIYIHTPCALIL